MVISVVVVGRSRTLKDATADYERRAGRYWRLQVDEVPQVKGQDAVRVCRGEAERIGSRLDPRYRLVVLTREGKRMSSPALARWLGQLAVRSEPGVQFVIGGAFGLSSDLISRADLALSLSSFTLPHDMARLLLAEQLYRAGTILRNEPYHKGGA